MSDIEDIRVDDPHTVRIKLQSANVDFPMFFGTDFLHIIPEGSDDFGTANGTGPFKVKFFEAGLAYRGKAAVQGPTSAGSEQTSAQACWHSIKVS